MPPRKKEPAGAKKVEAITHEEKRVNIPTADAREFVDEAVHQPVQLRYPRDTTLDPQLVWKGKDEQDAEDLMVDAPPIYIQEKIDPRVLIENLRRTAARSAEEPEPTLFETFDGLDGLESVEFYKHAANWSNRLILGDSLQVMGSLAERENLRGQVQMIYMDPPYGIKFGSNWQVSTRRRDVKDGKVDDATREVEQIKAFRDTWELGVNSYLAYMRDRLVAARDLLAESGSIFVQIGDENVHLIRSLLDEVFGPRNFLSQITFRKTSPLGSTGLPSIADFVVWYARDIDSVKRRSLFAGKGFGGDSTYTWLELADGARRKMTSEERRDPDLLPVGSRPYALDNLRSSGYTETCFFPITVGDQVFPPQKYSWKTNASGVERLKIARRIQTTKSLPYYVRFHDDFAVTELNNVWMDTRGEMDMRYVVQTSARVIERCILLATDPGDLVIDPTCGGGTTAFASEQWGRRWITIDTSRVALALTRQRIMGSKFPHYLLTDSVDGRAKEVSLTGQFREATSVRGDVRKGFVLKRVPHVTLRSIANNPDVADGMSREGIDQAIARYADSELLVDMPYEDTKKVRVAGPFTVETLSPHRSIDPNSPTETALDAEVAQAFDQMLLENVQRSGVQNGRKSERFDFDQIESTPGKYVVARAIPRGDLADQSVAISIGPRYGTVGADWIKSAAREAMKGAGHDVLLVLGFAFDPRALETVEEFAARGDAFEVQAEHQAGSIRVLLVRMNADLAMGETLLKKSKAANLFTVFGEPDIAPPIWTQEGWVVSIRGFDVYNPLTGEVRAGTEEEIAMWMIDTDYDEESFFVRHAYFLGNDPYGKLKKALKADINDEAWATLNSATSRPFSQPSTGKIAIKVINHYGDELLTVLDLTAPTA